MSGTRRPPRAAEWLLERALPDGVVGESIVGDMRESYAAAVASVGVVRASLRYWLDVLRIAFARPGAAAEARVWSSGGRFTGLGEDLRQTFRSLRRTPGFTLVTVLTVGVGVGAVSTVYSVIDGVLLKPLPYEDPESLVTVLHAAPGIGADQLGLSTGTFFTYLDESRTLDGIALWANDLVGVTGQGVPEEVSAAVVTDGMFGLLGVQAALGRLFRASDAVRGGPQVAVVSDGYWRTRLGGDPSSVGRTLTIEGIPVEVIGVLPQGFRLMGLSPALIFPFHFDRATAFVGTFNYNGVARMRPGETIASVTAELERLTPIAAETYPGAATVERVREMQLMPVVIPLAESIVGDIGQTLWLLLGATVFLLLVGCANVVNLFLVRAESRHQEWTIRVALGAARGRMARLFLMDSSMLAAASGVLGLLVAVAGIRGLHAFGPTNVPGLERATVDLSVIGLTLFAGLLAMIALGLVPFLRYGRLARGVLGGIGRGSSGNVQRVRARRGLAVLQLALALTLIIGAGLMLRTLSAMRAIPLGFAAADRILTFRVAVPEREASEPALVIDTHRRIIAAVEAIPGVESVGVSTSVPMDGRLYGNSTTVEDRQNETAQSRRYKFVSERFFLTMGTPLLAGRGFTWDDVEARRDVAIVSESFAREYWSSPDAAIGRRIAQNPEAGWREVVGVVADVRDDGPTEQPPAIVYWPIAARDFWGVEDFVQRSLVYAVRIDGVAASGLGEAVRQAVWSVNDRLPVADLRTQQAIVDAHTARSSFLVTLLSLAALIAVALGVIGLYGVTSYVVASRTREIGIRVALGAAPARVLGMILRQGAALAALGVAVGVGLAALLTRLLASLLYGVTPLDTVTFVLSSGLLTTVALVATGIPAARAAAIDPVRALEVD